jgi:hypothetical protein
LPFDIADYPHLKTIIDKAYKKTIVYREDVDGAHDANWAKEYELFYNTQPDAKPYVKRVFFKEDIPRGGKIGFVHLRPVSDAGLISEAYLKPPKLLSPKNSVYVKCLGFYDDYGEIVECVPYIMPDGIFGMCIHGSIWICLKILERRKTIQKSLCVPEIQTLVSGRPYTDKEGLVFKQAARLLRMCRTNTVYKDNKTPSILTDDQMLFELYAYVESGFPVILGVDVADLEWWRDEEGKASDHGFHSIVTIGHTLEKNRINGFVFHDESVLPYQTLTNDQLLKAWHHKDETDPKDFTREYLVAVPPQVTLEFAEAYHQFDKMLTILRQSGVIEKETKMYQIRPILTETVPFFLEHRDPFLLPALNEVGIWPEYIWAFTLFNGDDNRMDAGSSKGVFIRDATLKTEFRFFHIKAANKAIYQLGDELYSKTLRKDGLVSSRKTKVKEISLK